MSRALCTSWCSPCPSASAKVRWYCTSVKVRCKDPVKIVAADTKPASSAYTTHCAAEGVSRGEALTFDFRLFKFYKPQLWIAAPHRLFINVNSAYEAPFLCVIFALGNSMKHNFLPNRVNFKEDERVGGSRPRDGLYPSFSSPSPIQ